ncbi:AzlC family ABC transporter permease [Schaalia sp. 19OD2882]|uniref:AzlC family ABC transporter permease n=1 Tax=Schaalia sp. 19OD2882 TaxID=2794089 RepID=UPI001C1EE7BC|nr:AzlC family ABC transporter permease [Schaalia sp. 19OD2882]QWW20774.1 AzlC family ABC transporter permease [Schaalia sp. 19OD2882]
MRAAPATSTGREIVEGLRIVAPAALGYVPLGIAFGLLVAQSNLPWWMAPALSLTAYSGSAELLLVGLASAGTPLATIAVTTFLVNSRHVFYAFSFPLKAVRGPGARLYSMYALVDEAYALTVARPQGWTHTRLLAMQVALQSTWVASGLVGVGTGSLLPGRIEGLDFALCAMFITLALDAARTRAEVPSVLLAGLAMILAWFLAPGQWLLTSLGVFVGLLCLRHLWVRAGSWRTRDEGGQVRS